MKESPILFQPWKVRKMLGWNYLTQGWMQTRRVMDTLPFPWVEKVVPGPFEDGDVLYGKAGDWIQVSESGDHLLGLGKCRYGVPGDLLWVKETFTETENGEYLYKATHPKDEPHPKWRSSLYMPKRAARIWLEVMDVRAQRLHEITTEDIRAEGIEKTADGEWLAPLAGVDGFPWGRADLAFASLWNDINDKGGNSWESNPWVWAVSYRLHSVTNSLAAA